MRARADRPREVLQLECLGDRLALTPPAVQCGEPPGDLVLRHRIHISLPSVHRIAGRVSYASPVPASAVHAITSFEFGFSKPSFTVARAGRASSGQCFTYSAFM